MSELPRVMAILAAVGLGSDLSMVPADVLEVARQRGTAVHAAIEALCYGYLDPSDVTPEIAPRLDAYRKFIADTGAEFVAAEFEVIHPMWQYVGHPDWRGWLLGKRSILDWKNVDSLELPPAARQLAAYGLAWNAMHPDELVEALAVVQLRSDGTYRLHEIDTDERARREQEFLAALTVFNARKEIAA